MLENVEQEEDEEREKNSGGGERKYNGKRENIMGRENRIMESMREN